MKKSKLIFGLIALIIIVLCLIILADPARDNTLGGADNPTTPGSQISPPVDPSDPDASTDPLPTSKPFDFSTIEIADNVTINQVEPNPNEVIAIGAPITSDDPEYMNSGSDTYNTAEGKVYRNDKTISIDIFDEMTGETHTITFGYITGECNRFLYLNPVVEQEEVNYHYKYGFFFKGMPGAGSIITLPQEYASEAEERESKTYSVNFTVGRALDMREVSTYQDPTHPGTVWFTQMPLSGSLWIDVICYRITGDIMATLRLTIAKGPDGSYSIVNLENLNLLQTYQEEDSLFTKEELGYIYSMAMDVFGDPARLQSNIRGTVEDYTIERCIIQYRDEHSGFFYPYIVPPENGIYIESSLYEHSPVVSVTVRRHLASAISCTMYFQVIKPPTEDTHGVYEYIGRDFTHYTDMDILITSGYPKT